MNPWDFTGSSQLMSMWQSPMGAVPAQASALQNYAGLSGTSAQNYPSYPNQAGAGSQQGIMNPMSPMNVPQMQAPQYPGTGTIGNGTSTQQNATSQGFNPWSLSGEAMSRVK